MIIRTGRALSAGDRGGGQCVPALAATENWIAPDEIAAMASRPMPQTMSLSGDGSWLIAASRRLVGDIGVAASGPSWFDRVSAVAHSAAAPLNTRTVPRIAM